MQHHYIANQSVPSSSGRSLPTVDPSDGQPFGGVESSGYGREKGFEALYGFTTIKTVAIKHG